MLTESNERHYFLLLCKKVTTFKNKYKHLVMEMSPAGGGQGGGQTSKQNPIAFKYIRLRKTKFVLDGDSENLPRIQPARGQESCTCDIPLQEKGNSEQHCQSVECECCHNEFVADDSVCFIVRLVAIIKFQRHGNIFCHEMFQSRADIYY